jgi:hypothetical protein
VEVPLPRLDVTELQQSLHQRPLIPGEFRQRDCGRVLGGYGVEEQRSGVLGVALQVAFERQTLKPFFHLIGYRLWV